MKTNYSYNEMKRAFECGRNFQLTGENNFQELIEELNQALPQADVSGSVSFPNQKRVMFKFDDDEPMHLNSIFEGGEFIIKLKEGKIKFEKGGKSFELYVE